MLILLLACVEDTRDTSSPGANLDDTADTGTDTEADWITPAAPEACGYTAGSTPGAGTATLDLVASDFAWDPGTGTLLETGLAFNGTVPGPLIEANAGDTVVVNFTNDTDTEMTIHWHGLRITPEMDGVMQMMDPVQPGESFTYEFVPPDAGFYWYHPHMSGDTLLERGLYGTMIIREASEGRADCDLPIVLDDVLLDDDTRQIAPPDTDMMQLMGRLGNVLMANGRALRSYEVTRGQTILLRLVNSSNARFWDVRLEGHTMTVVGADSGFLAEPYVAEHLLVVPGERYMVLVEATGEPGQSYAFLNNRFQLHDDEHSSMVEYDPMGEQENPVFYLTYGEGEVEGTPWVQPTPDIPAFEDNVPTTFGHQWVLDEDMMGGTVTIDGAAWPDVPMVTVQGNVDTLFEVKNDSEMHHPFHIHGNRFQLLAIDGVPVEGPPAWKDTWDAPPMSTLSFASPLDNPGEWMYHCHILEHAEDGMAGLMTVEE
ncbi:MAG: multicopper oxidase family protein [Deltaproteobacteria bacterium]|nr:multicopper oxidase family protein [Deltaproteobacteria bacterium]